MQFVQLLIGNMQGYARGSHLNATSRSEKELRFWPVGRWRQLRGGAWSRPFGDSVALAAGTLAQPTMGPDDDFEDQALGACTPRQLLGLDLGI